MRTTLLPVAFAAILALPAAAQPGLGIDSAQEKPAVQEPAPSGPGISSGADTLKATDVAPREGKGLVPASPASKPPAAENPYDETADAKADVAAAVSKARLEKKKVLVTLGGNWCGWCRALDRTLRDDDETSAAIAKAYVPVRVDVGRMTKNLDLAATWGADPKKGVPLLVVLDSLGNAVKVQDAESLEAGRGYDRAKLVAFLESNARR